MPLPKPSGCLYPECPTHHFSRGLCQAHYTAARRLIRRGHATEKDLVDRCLLLPRIASSPNNSALLKGSRVLGGRNGD